MENLLKLAPLVLLILGVVVVVWRGLSKKDVSDRNTETHSTSNVDD